MGTTIITPKDSKALGTAAKRLRAARHVAVLTGAGISVESGIPDFRSPGGLWTVYDPQEYATIEAFMQSPAKVWEFYRLLARNLASKRPNAAHHALARLEGAGYLEAIVTQNVDGLHQEAGSSKVLEIHGDCRRLQCLWCDWLGPLTEEDLQEEGVPTCPRCGQPLKPNMVLFGEEVRHMQEIEPLIGRCDLLLVIGTSAQVYPAASLPSRVARSGGAIFEFNLEPTELTRGSGGPWRHLEPSVRSKFFFQGQASITVPMLVDAVLAQDAGSC